MEKMYTYAKFRIHPGKLEQFRTLARRAVEIVRERERGTLFYEWFINEAGTECVALDCYESLDAVMEHVKNMAPVMRELMSISDRHLEIYGADPTERFGGKTTARASEYFAPWFAGKPVGG